MFFLQKYVSLPVVTRETGQKIHDKKLWGVYMLGSGEFRKAIVGGFRQDDVMDYIKALGSECKKREDILSQRIDDLLTDKETLEKEIQVLQDSIGSAQKKIEAFKQDCADYEEEIAQLKQKEEDWKSKLRASQEQLRQQGQQVAEANQRAEEKQAEAEQIAQKMAQVMQENVRLGSQIQLNEETYVRYQEINSHFGEILNHAHRQADQMVDEALKEMEDVTLSSQQTMSTFRDQMENLQSDIEKFEKIVVSNAKLIQERIIQFSVNVEESRRLLGDKQKRNLERQKTNSETQLTIDMSVLDELEDSEPLAQTTPAE